MRTMSAIEAATEAMVEGWSILPIPSGKKAAPPAGTTGWSKRFMTEEEIFENMSEESNYALSLEKGVIGLDFDLYKNSGMLDSLQEKFGSLPLGTVGVSSKEKPFEQGMTLFYKIPESFIAKTGIGVLDFIQYQHRYSVAGGSIHPSGSKYRWLQGGQIVPFTPSPEDILTLPEEWLSGIEAEKEVIANEPIDFIEEFSEFDLKTMCSGMQRSVSRVNLSNSSRHDSMTRAVWGISMQRAKGCMGFEVACEILFEKWKTMFSESEQHGRDLGFEFLRAKSSAVAKNPVRNVCNCWQSNGCEAIGVTRGLFR